MAGLVGAAVITIVVRGLITRQRLKEELARQGLKEAIADAVDRCTNVVDLRDLETGNRVQVKGDGISYDVRENDIITTTY